MYARSPCPQVAVGVGRIGSEMTNGPRRDRFAKAIRVGISQPALWCCTELTPHPGSEGV